jgi:putative CocE/NonD family hydrolase
LNKSPQTFDEGYKVYVHDPNDAIAAIGGANMIVRTPQSTRNSQGQFNLADRNTDGTGYAQFGYDRTGIIHYATETLTDTLCAIGFPRVKLYAKTNPDGLSNVPTSTDFIVRFLDEYPDGSVYFVTEAVVNARAREFAKALVHADINKMDSMDIIDNIPFTNINAGEIYEYYFAGMPIAYTWGKGHKMRVMICSSNHTRYQVNPNLPSEDGEFFRRQPSDGQKYVFEGVEMEPRIAVQRVAHSDIYKTHISLPIYQKNITGVNEVSKYVGIEAEVYPNPSSGVVTIFANRIETLKKKVYNSMGQMVMEDSFNETTQFDVSSFETGMYFIELVNQKGKEKLVKKLTVY